jgi:nicotinamide-nucleotide amidase
MSGASPAAEAADVLSAVAARGWTLAVAESLTGGLVTAALVAVPGASSVLRGGVTAYATDVKASVLGVDAELLTDRGAVDADVARQMARGVRRLLRADVGLATTGVAGPDPQDGKAPGVVHVAVSSPERTQARELLLDGDRAAVREAAVREVLELARRVVGG